MAGRNSLEHSIFRYIWQHTKREQAVILTIVLISMVPYYLAFDLPKQIVNGPIQGMGFSGPDSTAAFLRISPNLPLFGEVTLFEGWDLERIPLLLALSLTFLALVIINGLFKFFINTFKGLLGERLLRRVRYELVDRILRFPPKRFRHMRAGEVSSMVKDEVEPLGGFAADAFTQPALLGGQALTALIFIFMQHAWLGGLAGAMALIQAVIIPRMRRRLIRLGRERQLTARQLAGRVAEIVEGIQTIHASDTTNYERADISARLGRIFRIRYDIYQWKFLVKFLNNFLAQLTPFLFYSIGGYLTIQGRLDVGQLVAVINAYKELPGPLKELIDWDLARQDVQVKYEQVVEQFESDTLIPPERHAGILPPGQEPPADATLDLQDVTLKESGGAAILSGITANFRPGESIAVVGGSADGGAAFGDLLAGVLRPSSGHVRYGDRDLDELPEAVTGRRIAYVGPGSHFFTGTMRDNLLYALRRWPDSKSGTWAGDRFGPEWHRREALRTGNPDLDITADWLDYEALQPVEGREGLSASMAAVLELVHLDPEVMRRALGRRLAAETAPEITDKVLAFRPAFRAELERRDLSELVLPFDYDRYNIQATIGENLFFGAPRDPSVSVRKMLRHPFFADWLRRSGLDSELFDLGWKFAAMTAEIFEGLGDQPDLMDWLSYMTPEELETYKVVLKRTEPGGVSIALQEDRRHLIRLAFSYVEPRFRFGLLTDDLCTKLVRQRHRLHAALPDDLQAQVQVFRENEYIEGATLGENILFGKINQRIGNAGEQIREIGRELMREHPKLFHAVLELGLNEEVGTGGQRLTRLQRQRLALARMLVRRSSFYIFSEPLAGADLDLQERAVRGILRFLRSCPNPPGVIWILSDPRLARHFDRVLRLQRGRLSPDETDD